MVTMERHWVIEQLARRLADRGDLGADFQKWQSILSHYSNTQLAREYERVCFSGVEVVNSVVKGIPMGSEPKKPGTALMLPKAELEPVCPVASSSGKEERNKRMAEGHAPLAKPACESRVSRAPGYRTPSTPPGQAAGRYYQDCGYESYGYYNRHGRYIGEDDHNDFDPDAWWKH